MAVVTRYDRGGIQSTRTQEGYLYAEAVATRTGVFPYQHEDGSTQWELRHPDDVLDADSLSTLGRKPVTNDHPPVEVNAANWIDYAVGDIDGEIEGVHDPKIRDYGFVKVKLAINKLDAIQAVQGGKNELSCGYTCDLKPESGLYQGVAYTARQTNIRYNHLAIVDAGRMNFWDPKRPVAKLMLDSMNTGVQVDVVQPGPAVPPVNVVNITGLDAADIARQITAEISRAFPALVPTPPGVQKENPIMAERVAKLKIDASEFGDLPESVVTAVSAKLREQERDMAELTRRGDAASADLAAARQKLAGQDEKLAALKDELAKARRDAEEALAGKAEAEKDAEESEAEAKSAEESRKLAESKAAEAAGKVAVSEQAAKDAEVEAETAKKTAEAEIEARKAAEEARVKAEQEAAAAKSAQVAPAPGVSDEEVKVLQAEKAQAAKDAEEAKGEVQSLSARMNEASAKLADTETKFGDLQKQCDDLEAQKTAAEQKMADMQAKMADVETQHAALMQTIAELAELVAEEEAAEPESDATVEGAMDRGDRRDAITAKIRTDRAFLPKAIQTIAAARTRVLDTAVRLLPKDQLATLDGLNAHDIRLRVLEAETPKSVKGWSQRQRADRSYVKARFDAVREGLEARGTLPPQVQIDATPPGAPPVIPDGNYYDNFVKAQVSQFVGPR